MDSRRATIELKYDNVDISRDVEPFITNFRYVDRTMHNQADELSVTFQNVDKLCSNGWFPERGAKLAATIKATNWFTQDDSFERDCGVFEIDDIDDSWPPSVFTVSAVSIGITNSIRRQQNTKPWENINIKEIAAEIASNHGFQLKWFSNYNPVLERHEQKSQSDLSVLVDICEYAGLMLKITGEHLIIFRGEQFDAEPASKTLYKMRDGFKNARFNANSSDIYSACQVQYYDPASLYESLQDICESGKPQPVFLEGENKGLFNILNVEGETTHWAFDRPAVMSISLVLQEYVESLPTVAEQKLREDELKREDTGKGEPERLPGTGAPTQARNLTPATSNETGFVK